VNDLLSTHTLTFTRKAAAALGDDGRLTDGTTSSFCATGSLQPLKGIQQNILPQGKTSADARRFYTKTEVKTADQFNRTPADETVIGGRTYEVFTVEDWSGYGTDEDHYKCILLRKDMT